MLHATEQQQITLFGLEMARVDMLEVSKSCNRALQFHIFVCENFCDFAEGDTLTAGRSGVTKPYFVSGS